MVDEVFSDKLSDSLSDCFVAVLGVGVSSVYDMPSVIFLEYYISIKYAVNSRGIREGMTEREEECSTERAERSTSVVREGVCKSKGWNGRWDAQGAGVECKTERKLSSERGPSQPGPPTEDAERQFGWLGSESHVDRDV